MDTLLCVPQGEFTLKRLPPRKRELLRAWDAADEYLLIIWLRNSWFHQQIEC